MCFKLEYTKIAILFIYQLKQKEIQIIKKIILSRFKVENERTNRLRHKSTIGSGFGMNYITVKIIKHKSK